MAPLRLCLALIPRSPIRFSEKSFRRSGSASEMYLRLQERIFEMLLDSAARFSGPVSNGQFRESAFSGTSIRRDFRVRVFPQGRGHGALFLPPKSGALRKHPADFRHPSTPTTSSLLSLCPGDLGVVRANSPFTGSPRVKSPRRNNNFTQSV